MATDVALVRWRSDAEDTYEGLAVSLIFEVAQYLEHPKIVRAAWLGDDVYLYRETMIYDAEKLPLIAAYVQAGVLRAAFRNLAGRTC